MRITDRQTKLISIGLRLTTLGLAAGLMGPARGQADWSEGFEQASPTNFPNRGPDDLVAAGWDFRLQTNSGGNVRIWEHHSASQFPTTSTSFSGTDHLQLFATHGQQSAFWAILPPIANQTAGDHVGLWVNKTSALTGGLLEIRYSPSGGIGTGTTGMSVGDFTDVLASDQSAQVGWYHLDEVVPGQGRLAIRVVRIHPSNATITNIDEISVGPMQTCPGCLPLPTAGQTVHWTLADSPVVIDETRTIVAGGTVIVDPGVAVEITGSQTQLLVAGRIEFGPGSALRQMTNGSKMSVAGPAAEARFDGTATNPVLLLGGSHQLEGIDVDQGGTLRLNHANVSLGIHGATFLFQDLAPTVVVENSTFTGQSPLQDLHLETGTLVARNCVFAGPHLRTEDVYLTLDAVTFDGSKLDTDRRHAGQAMVLDNLVGVNVPDGAPFKLRGSQHHFGPGNVIQGNRWPVELGGGLTIDSTLPTSGNAENVIHLDSLGIGPTTLPNIGLAFEALESVGGTHCDVSPGVTFSMGAGASFGPSGGGGGLYEVNLRGTPQQPIRFGAKSPGQPWGGLSWNEDGARAVAEWVEVRGAQRAVFANFGTNPLLLNFLLEGNEIGGYGANLASPRFRKSRFVNNGIGVSTSPGVAGTNGIGAGNFDVESMSNPCSFEGNNQGAWDQSVQAPSRARFAWWGSPSGPQAASNPGGGGDSVTGSVNYLPFATTPPDFSNTPPSVRLRDMTPRAQGGSRLILHWDASDDGQIVAYRLEHTPDHFCDLYTIFEENIPGDATSWVVDVPVADTSSSCVYNAAFRIVAIDDAGQEGYDVWDYQDPLPNTVEPLPTITPMATVARPGENLLFSTTNTSVTSVTQVHIDCEQAVYNQGSLQRLVMAPVSTDLARLSVTRASSVQQGNLQGFSDYFEIRPDPLITGDFPPTVDLLSPVQGEVYVMGNTIPVRWNASDDLGLRSFEIQASYDGGLAWHVVEDNIDGTLREFDWRLPSGGQGIGDVRLRVLARDTHFQVTSDGSARAFSITAGAAVTSKSAVGNGYCGPAVPNSTGSDGRLVALGDDVAASNDITLVANELPQFTFGMFLNSPDQGLVVGAGGSEGDLCLGSSIGRYSAPGQVQSSGVAGRIDLVLNLNATPRPSSFVAVVAGQTWNFQAWFRDTAPSGGPSSNFTNGVTVNFR